MEKPTRSEKSPSDASDSSPTELRGNSRQVAQSVLDKCLTIMSPYVQVDSAAIQNTPLNVRIRKTLSGERREIIGSDRDMDWAEDCLSLIEIRDPLKTHWNPRFKIWRTSPHSFNLEITITTAHRDNGEPVEVHQDGRFSAAAIERRDEHHFIHEVHHHLVRFMFHEVDESFHVNGIRVYEPHPETINAKVVPRS